MWLAAAFNSIESLKIVENIAEMFIYVTLCWRFTLTWPQSTVVENLPYKSKLNYLLQQ